MIGASRSVPGSNCLLGYTCLVVTHAKNAVLYSRRKSSLNRKFPFIIEALRELPERVVVDGELVAMDESGHPSFNLLQNFRSKVTNIYYYVFDLLCWQNRAFLKLPYIERRALPKEVIQLFSGHIKISEWMDVSASQMLAAAREHGLEGVIGKRRDSIYEPGKRSRA